MATTSVTMRMDEKLKAELQDLMNDLGLDLTTYFTMAAKQAVRMQAIPFTVSREIVDERTRKTFKGVDE